MNAKDFFNEVTNLIKAIGTSSSANEERDERSVENYVRQSANTNTKSQMGGNTMSNTTEPDPQGQIAVNKLIDQMTRPTDDVSVSDAPNNPAIVPDQETIPSSATSAIKPTSKEMAEAVEKADAGKCPHCGQAMPVEKADEPKDAEEMTKAATCSDCGKSMDLCDCMGKAVDEKESKEEAAKETPADEAKEMKKSLWGGAFAPVK
jgi:hypothetical protein